jgi:cutinase
MKCFIPLSLLVASVVAAPTAAPSPQEGASFPITDLVDSDLTVEEYASQLESQPAGEPAVTKRQFNGDTFNQLTDGTPYVC